MGVRGTVVGRIPTKREGSKRPGSRCGRVAERRPTTVLCADCTDTMSPAEVRAWRSAA